MLGMLAIRALATDIKFSHTIFAMPFAILGAMMAGTMPHPPLLTLASPDDLKVMADYLPTWSNLGLQFALIIICMILARTSAMLANRILDRNIDKTNPRTANRALPSGDVTLKQAIIVVVCINMLFIVATAFFGILWNNWLPIILAIPILVWLGCYPLLKRFTSLCHFFLGASLALSPIAAAIAINPSAIEMPSIWWLSGAVLFWVTGFDIIYALQDLEIDLKDGNKSIPALLGARNARLLSLGLHCFCIQMLWWTAATHPKFEWLFFTATCFVAGLLLLEHFITHKWGTLKITLTFFTLNGFVSCILGICGILDLLG